MAVTTQFKSGEQVTYKGQKATVVKNSLSTGTTVIKIGDKFITVKSNLLKSLGIFDVAASMFSNDEYIEKLNDEMVYYKKWYSASEKGEALYKEECNKILRNADVSDASDLKSSSQKKKYEEAKENRTIQHKNKNRAGSGILSTAISLLSEYCHKLMYNLP